MLANLRDLGRLAGWPVGRLAGLAAALLVAVVLALLCHSRTPPPLVGDFPTVERSSRGLALAMLPHVAALVAPSARVRTRANRGTRQGLSRSASAVAMLGMLAPVSVDLTAVSAQPSGPSECAHGQPASGASLPKSRGHTFAAQAVGGLAGVRFDAVSQECRRQPERIGDPLDGIKARDVAQAFKLDLKAPCSHRKARSNGDAIKPS
jgi:hypothetical protein